jgi:hypothetical protein
MFLIFRFAPSGPILWLGSTLKFPKGIVEKSLGVNEDEAPAGMQAHKTKA